MNKKQLFCSTIVVAGGTGSRMGLSQNKVFCELGGIPILARTLLAFESCPFVQEIVLVGREDELSLCHEIVDKFSVTKLTALVPGGAQRQHSVYNGLSAVSDKCDIVAIHDAARPFVTQRAIKSVIDAAVSHRAAALGVKCKDTIKMCDDDQSICQTLPRDQLWLIQTPQVFERNLLVNAYDRIGDSIVTDDCSVVEHMGVSPLLVEGDYSNIKITTKEDLLFGEWFLQNSNT
jgi:2-C-methyl-D-erythritol 4-phosphate cytidylyltransferase